MRPHESRAPRTRLVVVLALSASACTTWHVEPLPSPESGPMHVAGTVRVRPRSGATVDLQSVIVTRDSIIGITVPDDIHGLGGQWDRVAFARRDVIETQAPAKSVELTALAVIVGTVTAIFGTLFALAYLLGSG